MENITWETDCYRHRHHRQLSCAKLVAGNSFICQAWASEGGTGKGKPPAFCVLTFSCFIFSKKAFS